MWQLAYEGNAWVIRLGKPGNCFEESNLAIAKDDEATAQAWATELITSVGGNIKGWRPTAWTPIAAEQPPTE